MRVLTGVAAVALIGGLVPLPTSAPAKDPAAILAAARQALGGDKKIAAVTSFSATGRTQQVRGENLVPIEFEISVELPDKYLRKDEIPAQESGPNASGFNGDALLQEPPPPAPAAPPAAAPGRQGAPPGREGAAAPPRNPNAARVTTLKQDFARLMLGMFAASYSAYPLTFTYVGEAEAPQGKADVLDAKGPGGFTLRYFVNVDTHLPIMVSWHAPAPPQRGRGPMLAAPGAAPGAPAGAAAVPPAAAPAPVPPTGAAPSVPPTGAAAPQAPPEQRLYFSEYRDESGLQLPFRLRRATGTDTTEETTFDRFRINAKIDPRKFEVRK
jgi:hypothetical protein